ncbi:flagellar basal body L-ring protein FlgH [Ramlibacter alkalitolerans]|uniref:Flagellar L-ring protein n=1 Tax=Ramlibacter alkalitolerans TaxID=2039631 RepID=A0ABS1JKT8_9BURK|nr:flagellar basal body L-ring protein FlgH [Ramlibacter alkalitolerans]MBL0424855.1 flagellar basal body L-ring protein FlgH [Ramlibacter alkalitolerans]
MKTFAALAAACLLAGCATVQAPAVDMHPAAPATSAAAAPATAPTTGAIFNAGTHRPLFEDRRARLVGDTLTIQIEETVSASQQSTTKLERANALGASTSALPYASARVLGRLGVDAKSDLNGKADGKTDSINTFTGTITVTVQQVLPNGNLVVTGEKQIGVNDNVDVLRFSGVVNPVTIRAGNLVSSTQVAEARLQQRGRGDVGRVQGLGWLTRFFLSIAPV